MLAAASLLAASYAAPVLSKDVQRPSQVTAVPYTTISGSPLSIVIGAEHSFQVENSDIPGVGQIFPPTSTGPADMGWFVRDGATLYAPDFGNHEAGSATGGLGAFTPFTAQSQSAVSGDGSAANPFRVTTTTTLGSSGLTATDVVTYVNGDNYFIKQFSVINNSATAHDLRIFLAGDIYLAASDSGVPYFDATLSSPGGQDCASPASYFILLIPQTPTTSYTGSSYSDVWGQVGSGQLSGSLTGTSCIDNGAGLQWNRTLAAGESTTIVAATSFGDIPGTVGQFDVASVAPSQGTQGDTVSVTITGSGFQAGTSFDFAAGVTVTNLVITGPTSATATLIIDAAAPIGLRDVIGMQSPGGLSDSLVDGFEVLGGPGGPPGGNPTVATPVPASGTWALGGMSLLLVLAGMLYLRRRN